MGSEPAEETQRLKALRDEEILDTPPEASFDGLVRLAAFICGTPISLVSLVDESRQWFKARVGLEAQETPRELAFCAHTILKPDDITIVEDAEKDDRFSENALVTGEPRIRFYAGAPLVTKDGFALGSLCVIDRVPRSLTTQQLDALKMVRNQVLRELEHRRSGMALTQLLATLEEKVEARTEEIASQNANLKDLTARLLAAQDDERRRIARELHDSTGQILAGVNMQLGMLAARGGPNVSEIAVECRDLLSQLNQEIRTMSYLLHPPLLDELGLATALSAYAEGLADRSGFEIFVDISNEFPRLPTKVEVALFRVTQECVTNVHRHSGAKSATVRLAIRERSVVLQVEDSGRGIPADKLASLRAGRGGVGLRGMRERIEHVGGAMEIESNGERTVVTFTVPQST